MTARGSIGWRDAFGDLNPTSVLAFGGCSGFSTAGTPITKNAAVIEAGLGYSILPGAPLDLSYGDQIGSHVIDQTVQATFDAKF